MRERHRLGHVSYNLFAAWQTALTHPGMLARFTSPVGFAVAQIQNRPEWMAEAVPEMVTLAQAMPA